jgi:LysM repeat protein
MNKRSSAAARTLAAIAVIGGFVLVLLVVVMGLSSSSDSGTTQSPNAKSAHQPTVPAKDVPKVYMIKSGDTLTAIAHSTGVSVAQIQRLNPTVDPQILIAGEKLKLR